MNGHIVKYVSFSLEIKRKNIFMENIMKVLVYEKKKSIKKITKKSVFYLFRL